MCRVGLYFWNYRRSQGKDIGCQPWVVDLCFPSCRLFHIVALVQAVMLSHDNVNYVAVAVFLNTLKQGVAASLWFCNLFEWQWASVKYRQVFMFQFLICSPCAFCDCVREGIPHFLEGEQQERVMSYLPLSHIAGMAVDITMWHPQKFFKSSVSPFPVMDRFFGEISRGRWQSQL